MTRSLYTKKILTGTVLEKKSSDMVIPEMPESKKNRHPEQRQGEVFMGNTISHAVWHDNWYSFRLGDIAYDINGKEIPKFEPDVRNNNLYPYFVSWEEYCVNKILGGYDPCEEDRTSG